MMDSILVRVKPGCRVVEAGMSWMEGQSFWIEKDRFSSLSDMVDKVAGVEPKIVGARTTAMESPQRIEPKGMPQPEARLVTPRTPVQVKPKVPGSKKGGK